MCTASGILKSMLCLKRTKATPTATQATGKNLKNVSRENQCFNSKFLQDILKAFSSLQVALAILVEQLGYVNFTVFGKLKGKNQIKRFKNPTIQR